MHKQAATNDAIEVKICNHAIRDAKQERNRPAQANDRFNQEPVRSPLHKELPNVHSTGNCSEATTHRRQQQHKEDKHSGSGTGEGRHWQKAAAQIFGTNCTVQWRPQLSACVARSARAETVAQSTQSSHQEYPSTSTGRVNVNNGVKRNAKDSRNNGTGAS